METITETKPLGIRRSGKNTDVLLVVPPFQSCSRPTLGVSQLKANLLRSGFNAKVLYLNFRYAERIGWRAYEAISLAPYRELLGEFIFSCLLFQRSEKDIQAYVERVLRNPSAKYFLGDFHEGMQVVEKLQRLIREADEFIRKDALPEILSHDPWLVGFTSSFHQNCASIAMIRGVNAQRPDAITVMGGANCESTMGEELLKQFPEIDYIGQGDGDYSFVELVRSLRQGNRQPEIAGILTRSGTTRAPALIRSNDLDSLPYPDFDDYFRLIKETVAGEHIVPSLVIETSRGCWWGAKSHCTFCGLNAETMVYRSKSAPRVVDEIKALVQRYDTHSIEMVDNILDMKYFKTLLPTLAEEPLADMFFETKANLTRSQVELMTRAKIKWIQPGIESLSDLTLQLMRKGITKLQNIQLLKWSEEYRLGVVWNILYGFPGESDEEIPQMAEDAKSLHHMQPPVCALVLRLDRFSPYFTDRERFGLGRLTVPEPYHHVYPFPDSSLEQLAYYFDTAFLDQKNSSEGFQKINRIANEWIGAYDRSHLVAFPTKGRLNVLDTRGCARRFWHRLKGTKREVYEYLDQVHTLAQIRNAFSQVEEPELDSILESLVSDKLVLRNNDHYLSLAVYASHGYSKFDRAAGRTGYTRTPRRSEKLSRDLKFLFRISPRRLVAAASNRALAKSQRMITRGIERAVVSLVRWNTRGPETPSSGTGLASNANMEARAN